jgi:polyisoprenoid-binding protein YceI
VSAETPRRAWVRNVILAVAALVVLAVAAPFVYIHFIEGSAPAKFSLSATGAGSSGPSVPLEGTWSVTRGSEAGYRVGEVLLGQNNTAVGRTTDITGSIVIKGTRVVSGSFTANLTSVHSDQQQRDGQFRRIMDTPADPTAQFTLSKPIEMGTPPASGVPMSVDAVGDLTLRGVKRPTTIPLTTEHVGTTLEVLGSLPVVFSDWKIPQPNFPGVAKVQDHGTLEFLLRLVPGAAPPATTAVPSTTIGGGGGGGGGGNQAFQQCLAQHGVTTPPGPPPTGGSGAGGGQQSPETQAAIQACSSLLPSGGGQPQITVSPTTVAPLQLGP